MASTLCLRSGFAHVKQRLPGHRRVLHALLLGQQRQHRFHERRFSCGGTGLHQDGQRRFQEPRSHRQIAHQLVGLLAHYAAPLEVHQDASEQLRIAQELERGGFFLRRYLDFFFLRLEHFVQPLVL